MSNKSYRLKSIKFSHFRGARDEISISTDNPLVAVVGPHGTGKTTVAKAVNHALAPEHTARLKHHGLSGTGKWPAQNLHSDTKPQTQVLLAEDEEEITIGQGAEGQDLESSGLSFHPNDLPMLHKQQEAINGLLSDTAGERESCFQRLLGAGEFQDMAKSVSKVNKSLKVADAENQANAQSIELEARQKEVKGSYDALVQSANAQGVEGPWNSTAHALHKEQVHKLEALCRDFDQSPPELPEAKPFYNYKRRMQSVYNALRSMGPSGRRTQLVARSNRIKSELQGYQTAVTQCQTTRAALEALIKQYGDKDRFEQEITRQRQTIAQCELKLRSVSQLVGLLDTTSEFLKSNDGLDQCPICESPVGADLRESVEKRLHIQSTAAQKEWRDMLEAARHQLFEKLRILGEFNQAEEKIASAEKQLFVSLEQLKTELQPCTLAEHQEPVKFTQNVLRDLAQEIQELEKQASLMFQRIQELESRADKITLVGELEIREQRLRTLEEIRRSEEWVEMESALEAIADESQKLKILQEAIKKVADEVSKANLCEAQEPVEKMFQTLTQRTDFSELMIDPSKKYNVFVGDDSASHAAVRVLNQADVYCLGLSLFLGMAMTFRDKHDLDFVMVDEPTTGLHDLDLRKRVGQVLAECAAQTQVLVFTSDDVLVDALKSETIKQSRIYLEKAATDKPQLTIARIED